MKISHQRLPLCFATLKDFIVGYTYSTKVLTLEHLSEEQLGGIRLSTEGAGNSRQTCQGSIIIKKKEKQKDRFSLGKIVKSPRKFLSVLPCLSVLLQNRAFRAQGSLAIFGENRRFFSIFPVYLLCFYSMSPVCLCSLRQQETLLSAVLLRIFEAEQPSMSAIDSNRQKSGPCPYLFKCLPLMIALRLKQQKHRLSQEMSPVICWYWPHRFGNSTNAQADLGVRVPSWKLPHPV